MKFHDKTDSPFPQNARHSSRDTFVFLLSPSFFFFESLCASNDVTSYDIRQTDVFLPAFGNAGHEYSTDSRSRVSTNFVLFILRFFLLFFSGSRFFVRSAIFNKIGGGSNDKHAETKAEEFTL